jgi:hypothetical protein
MEAQDPIAEVELPAQSAPDTEQAQTAASTWEHPHLLATAVFQVYSRNR